MNDITEIGVNFAEEYNAQTLKGLVAAVIDDVFSSFTYRGLEVELRGRRVVVTDPTEGVCLGEMKIKGAPIEGTAHWIDAKADLYGEEMVA